VQPTKNDNNNTIINRTSVLSNYFSPLGTITNQSINGNVIIEEQYQFTQWLETSND